MERKWDSRLDALEVRVESPPNAEIRLVEARWVGPEEAGDKANVYVRVQDEQGKPLSEHEFRMERREPQYNWPRAEIGHMPAIEAIKALAKETPLVIWPILASFRLLTRSRCNVILPPVVQVVARSKL